jgi:predicted MFS family arabinose efflux permease
MENATSASFNKAPLYWLALGTFAVGTEAFMIAGILPRIASDLGVSVPAAGQLVTAFAFCYAVSSPVLTTLFGGVNRRLLLILAMGAFMLANLLASSATGYWTLMGARILLACAAGLYVPGANALAGTLVPPERRGSALAIVNGGLTIAVAFGVPLGALIGNKLGWRMTFGMVALLAAIAGVGLVVGLRKDLGLGLATASLRERVGVARQPVVLLTLLTTALWAMGAYTIYTYLALFISTVTGIHGAWIGIILFMWGVAAALGVAAGGAANDKFGSRAVIAPCLVFVALAFVMLSGIAHFVPKTLAIIPVFVAVAIWGVAAWAFYPAQQARLIGIAGVRAAPIVLSLNASFMYLGFSLGAAIGSLTLAYSDVRNLGWVAALFEVASLLLVLGMSREKALKPAVSID